MQVVKEQLMAIASENTTTRLFPGLFTGTLKHAHSKLPIVTAPRWCESPLIIITLTK